MNSIFRYDVLIIGGGVIGTSIARYLSRYNLKLALLEKHNDVGDEASGANSGIMHSGYDPLPGTKKAYFNVLGNKMIETVSKELDVSFKRIGSITISLNEEDDKTLIELAKRAKENGVEVELLSKEETLKIEPNLTNDVRGALLAKSAGVVSPFALNVNLMENAMDNGAKLFLNSEVVKIEKIGEIYKVFTKNAHVFECKALINAAGVYSDEIVKMLETPNFKITPRKGEYYVLDHFDNEFLKHTIFMCPTKVGKGVLISQTASGNYLVGPSNDPSSKEDNSTDSLTLSEIKKIAQRICPSLPFDENIRQFSGIRPNNDTDDFIIEESKVNGNFFIVGGIMSPGLASSLAIGEYVSDLVAKKLNLTKKEKFNPTIKKHLSLGKLGKEKFNELIKENPLYGRMVCRCEKVSEAEIMDSINRNCGAHTIKGVKKRVRPGFGKCQGTFCESEVLKILARELKCDLSEVCYSDLGTNVVLKSTKGE